MSHGRVVAGFPPEADPRVKARNPRFTFLHTRVVEKRIRE
jgi:hypothetical protein